jgi:hypothetical protein
MLLQDVVIEIPVPAVTLPIPAAAGGRHLRIRARGASTATVDHVSVGLQINEDAQANYSWAWDEVIGGVPPAALPASGGDDETRARVGLVPGAALAVPFAGGDVDLQIPHFRDTTFVRSLFFTAGETLGIAGDISIRGHATYYAQRAFVLGSGGSTHTEPIGYAESPSGMQNGQLDPETGLWYDPAAGSPPNALRTVADPGSGTLGSGGSVSTPAVVTSVTLLLDVGQWVVGSRLSLYIEE